MASSGVSAFQRRKATFSLAALLLVGLLALALIISGIPATRAAGGPVLTVSSGTTNPGGKVTITGTGWSPAQFYNLYVYGASKCNPNPICAPPSGTKVINSKPEPIDNAGNLGTFDFTFVGTAKATNYVFTVVADAPADNPYTASVIVQVVPAGTPPSGVPVSSSPTATATAQPTKVPASPTTASQGTGGTGGQGTNIGGGNTLAIIVVTVLLIIAVAVLIGLLIVLPPKRRAIRAAWYGASSAGMPSGRGYGASGPMGQAPRRASSGYVPGGQPEPPAWMGGVAQWDDPPRGPRSSSRPRRPQGGDY